MTATASARPTVVLHVGAPKSGTTFLQRALWRHQAELREAGFLCPGDRAAEMFHAAIEVRDAFDTWGYDREELTGTWSRLCAQARAFEGTTIMSHELLAAATEEQIASALAELDGVDLHVVVTARDLSRQVMSEWQERIKNGSTQPFAKFHRSVSQQLQRRDFTSGLFWRYQDVPGILSKWGAGLPPENLHVVVAPPAGADPRELWLRFGEAVGYDAAALDPVSQTAMANQTLGTVQIAILRRVNDALQGRIVQPAYARVVKRRFAQGLLADHPSPRPSCPPGLLAELRALSEEWIAEIRDLQYAVHGDLTDLMPSEPPAGASDPDDVDPRAEADMAVALIADLLVEVEQLRGRARRQTPAAPEPVAGTWVRLRRRVPARVRVAIRSLGRR